jgi:hypothetical protein
MHFVSGVWKELPATLALLLVPDLTGARQREGERRLDALLSDLAADVTPHFPWKDAAATADRNKLGAATFVVASIALYSRAASRA